MTKIFACFIFLLMGQTVSAQGIKISVAVKIDSTAEGYYLRNFICDSFTCIFQDDKFLFYEKSYRVGIIDLNTGEIVDVKHLPPDKILIEKERLIFHNTFNNKMVSMETNKFSNPRIPFQMFGKFKYGEFSFTDESKTISGLVCKKGWSQGDSGDTTIIWIPKDTVYNNLKTIMNFFFLKPPTNPVLEISFKDFRMTEAIVEELRYSVYAFEIGDYSRAFQELKNYQRVTHEEFISEREAVSNEVYEKYKKEKGNNK